MKDLLKSGIFSIREVAKRSGYSYATLIAKLNGYGRSKWKDEDERRIREFLTEEMKGLFIPKERV